MADDALAKLSDKELTKQAEETGIPTITVRVGQAFPGDLRATSGLGLGDGLHSHTAKWLQVVLCGVWIQLPSAQLHKSLGIHRLTTRHQ